MIYGVLIRTDVRDARENGEAARAKRPDGLYTPLVPRPEGGASSIMLPRSQDRTAEAR